MAVTGRRAFLLAGLVAIACNAASARADDSADVHEVIGDMANALSSGEAVQAMAGFSKKCPNYDKLSEYFEGLTGAYFVENTLAFIDEEVSATEATVALHWDLSLTTKQGGSTKSRSADLKLKLVREGKHWRILEFNPAAFFDPSAQ